MKRKWGRVFATIAIIALPMLGYLLYRSMTALPREVVIATGPENGLYRKLSLSLGEQLKKRLRNVRVRFVHTTGSIENLKLLQEGRVDFAMYQPGAFEIIQKHAPETLKDMPHLPRVDKSNNEGVQFVANLYSQPAHFVVRRGAGIKRFADIANKRVSLGIRPSGDFAMSLLLLQHFGMSPKSFEASYDSYREMIRKFKAGELDAAIITIGIRAPVFQKLFKDKTCQLLPLTDVDAMSVKYLEVSDFLLPKGLYGTHPNAQPETNARTIAFAAQLLTRDKVHAGLVQEVTQIVIGEEFAKQNSLNELFTGGIAFASKRPEFAMHPGSQSMYDPAFDIHLVESLDAIYSLVASMLIATYFAVRWFTKRIASKRAHKLDKFVHSLLDIEQQQIGLDEDPEVDDMKKLQKLLDTVTVLRQEALREFTANELKEDRAVDCFIQMCHALSDKINAKISRQRMKQCFEELSNSLRTKPKLPAEEKPSS